MKSIVHRSANQRVRDFLEADTHIVGTRHSGHRRRLLNYHPDMRSLYTTIHKQGAEALAFRATRTALNACFA
jgi:hypothetical protein